MTLKPNNPTTVPLPSSKKAPETPVKIGTKGTVGSLMMKEIEYFNKLEVHSQRRRLQPIPEAAAAWRGGGQPRPKAVEYMNTTLKSKKRGNKFIPSICSAIDVADSNGPKMISGFSYKTLKEDVRRLQV